MNTETYMRRIVVIYCLQQGIIFDVLIGAPILKNVIPKLSFYKYVLGLVCISNDKVHLMLIAVYTNYIDMVIKKQYSQIIWSTWGTAKLPKLNMRHDIFPNNDNPLQQSILSNG